MRLRLAVIGIALAGSAAAETPDLIFHHGRIHTEDAARWVAEALALSGNTIVAVGTDREVDALAGPRTRIVDLAGRTVLPGIIDAHTHPADSAPDLDKCSLDDKPMTVAEVGAAVADCLKSHASDPHDWFEVVQVDSSNLTPTLRDLDAMLSARPMLMWSADGHTVWLNSKALALSGITRATPDPPGGRIGRDASGALTGALEDDAADLAIAHEPKPSLDRQADQLDRAFAQMRAVGITSVQDASVDERQMAVYKLLYDRHRLDMRVRGSYHLADLGRPAEELIEAAIRFRRKWAIDPDFLRADAVKIFADGVIEYPMHTAALIEPYLDAEGRPTDNRGPSYFVQENLDRIVGAADAAGFTVHVHAIGDRAVRGALDAFAAARRLNGFQDNRDQIAHLQLIDPADIPRFKALGVIANLQLLWAERDDYTEAAVAKYLGPERCSRMYPARSLRDAGALIAGGSDWDVSSFDPFAAMEHAITRAEAKGKEPLAPDQAVTLQDMVDAYTINAAFALKQEKTTGSLEPGKRGDLIVLDRDIFAIDPYELHATKVLATWLDGKQVYKAE